MEFKTEYQRQLMEAFGFNEDDLRTNRAGEMTPKQWKRFDDDYFVFKAVVAIISIVIFGLGLALLPGNKINLLLATLVSIGLNVGVQIFVVLLKYWRLSGDVQAKQVDNVCGRLHLAQDNESFNHFSAAIWGVNFPLTENQFKLLRDGDDYCIYYSFNAQTLLSLEWVREGEHFHL